VHKKSDRPVHLKMTPVLKKSGAVIHIYSKGEDASYKKVAEITPTNQIELAKDATLPEEAQATFLFKNLMAVMENGNFLPKDRISFYLPEGWQEKYVQAFNAAKKAKIEFNPAKRMYAALMEEIALATAENSFKKKHIRVLWKNLLNCST